jgi:cellulose synthase/poly-beta-1,6-N-acetylglucosamine synthase-like glycosyltransferase
MVLVVLLAALGLFWMVPAFFVMAICLPASVAFLMVSAVRMAAGVVPDRRPPPMLRFGRAPRYLVLVPLHDEAAVVGDLIRALAALKYPRERLTIVLIMEADDKATIAEVAGRRLPAHFRAVIVPDGKPRTKPRALNHAMSLFPSDLVTVYDAEDRPHPFQLIEAAQAFGRGGGRLACLQSPLVIDTIGPGSTWISRQFALEYDSLFRRVLPILATLGVPLPLGGTSMHLKRAVLDRVGGWDPYNVTEDADLGMRLARFGYRTECLVLPTYEEAPITARAWIGQRSRWLKGWLVTWFVHMRDPFALWREAGPLGFLSLNLIVFGAAIAAIAYPISVATILLGLGGVLPVFADRSLWGDVLLVSFLLAFLGGVGASLWLTAVSVMRTRAAPPHELLFTLAYWFLLFLAMGRAIKGLILKPSHWQKTAHGQAPRRAPMATSISRPAPRRAPLRGPGSPR